MGLFDRVGRVVRAEMNARQVTHENAWQNTERTGGSALAAGGAIAGASVGNVGVLAGGAGYSVGAIPLIAAGTLTGAALYEALRSLITQDGSSAGVAALGAAAGAGTSAAIGGVGVAAGGAAIGVGMAGMAAGGAVVGLGLVGLNRLLKHNLDPEKLMDTAIEQMTDDLEKARQSMLDMLTFRQQFRAQEIATKREMPKWHRHTQFALEKNDESLARQALEHEKVQVDALAKLENYLERVSASIETLQQTIERLEAKIREAKTLKTWMSFQISKGSLHHLGSSSTMGAFERMEQKVLMMEAKSQAAAEIGGASLDEVIAELESPELDAELEAMRRAMLGDNHSEITDQSVSETPQTKPQASVVDAELEDLKAQMEKL
ncbi:MAG: PspA/IM30 family protein [Leptolyngbyaceae cyanobacterium]